MISYSGQLPHCPDYPLCLSARSGSMIIVSYFCCISFVFGFYFLCICFVFPSYLFCICFVLVFYFHCNCLYERSSKVSPLQPGVEQVRRSRLIDHQRLRLQVGNYIGFLLGVELIRVVSCFVFCFKKLFVIGLGAVEVPTGLNSLAFDDDVKSGRIKIILHR